MCSLTSDSIPYGLVIDGSGDLMRELEDVTIKGVKTQQYTKDWLHYCQELGSMAD